MKSTKKFWIGIPIAILTLLTALATTPHARSSDANLAGSASFPAGNYDGVTEGEKAEVSARIAKARTPFIANEGQVDENVRFYARTFGGAVFVTRDGKIVYNLPFYEKDGTAADKGVSAVDPRFKNKRAAMTVGSPAPPGKSKARKIIRGVALEESLVKGAVKHIDGEGKSPTKVNIFHGGDKSKWITNIAAYERVSLGEVYEGVEVKLRAHGNNVEKLFFVQPGADAETIRLRLEGAKSLNVNHAGELEAETALGTVSFTAPAAWQEVDGVKKDIKVAYLAQGNEYGFSVGGYDRTKELVIDPLLASTLLGGGADDALYSMALDQSGNVYAAGFTFSGDFPATSGVYSESLNGPDDAFVSKLDSSLGTLLASTFLGGSGYDGANSLAIGQSGDVYVSGTTQSSDFPTTSGAYDENSNGESNVFISKLDSSLGILLASTFLGGSGYDGGRDLAIRQNGDVYVSGSTYSSDFPTTSGAYDENSNGVSKVFVSKLDSSLGILRASTFLGGSGFDRGAALAIDLSGDVYVSGSTLSSDFPATSGAYDESHNGEFDVFISKMDSGLATLLSSTFLGGDDEDKATALVTDPSGNVYVSGGASSADFPTTAGAFEDSYRGGGWMGVEPFISKLDSSLTVLLSSTFLGGLDACVESYSVCRQHISSLAVDQNGDVYATGSTSSPFFPTTFGAYDVIHNGREDCTPPDFSYYDCVYYYDIFISKLNNDLTTMKSSTFLGGEDDDYGNSIITDQSGNVYVAGFTLSADFPTASGAFAQNMGVRDVFVSKFDSDLSAETTIRILEPDGVDDVADVAFTIAWVDESPAYNTDISLYYDTDNTGVDGTLIVDSISEDDETDAYVWDVTTLEDGEYYVYAVIDDGSNPTAVDYSDYPVVVYHGPPPAGLTISSTTGGSVVEPGEGVFSHYLGDTVNIVAAADAGYHFVNWTGDVSEAADVNAAGTTITMAGDHSIVANFELDNAATIDILEPDGVADFASTGFTITWADEGPVNDASVSLYYDTDNTGQDGTLIVDGISEDDETDAYFWITAFLPEGDYYVYAVIDDGNFPAAVDYSDGPVVFHHGGPFRNLTISSSAGGSVTRPGEGVFIRFFGTPVHLAAEAKRGYRFVNWTGDVAGLANVDAAVTTIIVHGDHSIIANFVAAGAPMR